MHSKSKRFEFGLEGQRDLELSTQVLLKSALARGLRFEVLDRSSNAVRLNDPRSGKSEIVIQATKTSKDSYLCTEIMGLKKLTKLLLSEAGLRVPKGEDFQSLEQALAAFTVESKRWQGRDLIVKPNSTNYGIGITKLTETSGEQDVRRALDLAFSCDSSVLVEEFIAGKEYRFLVIDGSLQAVLHRIPANVTGDGHSSIETLVEKKNRDPWRIGPQGGHTSPLESIELNPNEIAVLREQGLAPESIPAAGAQIFLRHNSNISSGGDSLDMSDAHHPGYRDLAEASARTLGAKICGVDVISADITAAPAQTPHAIIEANFNPVLYFHEYPAEGKPRPVADAVIELLFS